MLNSNETISPEEPIVIGGHNLGPVAKVYALDTVENIGYALDTVENIGSFVRIVD
jgi:hypothetical protein